MHRPSTTSSSSRPAKAENTQRRPRRSMTDSPAPGMRWLDPGWRSATLGIVLAAVAGALFPRRTRWMRWPHGPSPRGPLTDSSFLGSCAAARRNAARRPAAGCVSSRRQHFPQMSPRRQVAVVFPPPRYGWLTECDERSDHAPDGYVMRLTSPRDSVQIRRLVSTMPSPRDRSRMPVTPHGRDAPKPAHVG